MPNATEPTDEARSTLVRNERAKLTATYVNGVAIAVLAVGGLAPVFAVRPSGTPSLSVLASSILCFCVSAALHWAARRFLKELR